MKWYFRFSEFVNLDGESFVATPDITDKIVKNFMVPLNRIREELGSPIYIRSCYRPHYWEIQQGRDGGSQHIFRGEGAVDCSLTPNSESGAIGWKELFGLLEEEYTRVCWYPEERFFHCDHKGHQKLTFINEGRWKYIGKDELLSKIPE